MPPTSEYGMQMTEELFLDRARLRVGAVEDRDLAERRAGGDPLLDLRGEPQRFVALVDDLLDDDRAVTLVLGVELVATHEPGRARDDLRRRPVVPSELDDLVIGEVPAQVVEVERVRAAPRVDRLIRIADRTEVLVTGGEQLRDQVLRTVGVLESSTRTYSWRAPALEHVGTLTEDAQRGQQQASKSSVPLLERVRDSRGSTSRRSSRGG